ncbi:glycoside hydrolase family 108 protein [Dethiosulfatarculus sandiegensis]|uniref:Secretion activator protein n=1 Tax=Dethiosulfatarculus sandiegensis TaxID=1429043 RepID=A0A0D2HXC8_9BACT|nr:glycosyl hydrolase 108 family protein [Dethiosulfatarculus sandiegensis]KIX14988.1 secretion activator protein [Dethiosulfatarculus sandiegensis]
MDKRLLPFRQQYYGAFLPAVNFVLDHEGWGKESDHPADPGGRTRFGISARHHGRVPLTLPRALEIYFQDYWLPIKGESLPPLLDLALFDSAVLCGVRKSVQWLQLELNDLLSPDQKLEADGIIGPKTMQGIDAVTGILGSEKLLCMSCRFRYLVSGLIWRRQAYHAKRVALRPDQAKWGHGWSRRCAALVKKVWNGIG